MNWLDKNKFFEKLLILTWIIFLFSCLYLLSFTSHAEEAYFPMLQNNNSKFSEAVKTKIDQTYDNENNYIFCRWDSYSSNRNTIYVLYFPKNSGNMIYGEIGSNGYSFSLYYSAGTFPSANIERIQIPDNASYINRFTGYNLSIFSGSSNLYSSSTDYISNFRMYTNNTNETVFMKYGPDPEPEITGHATPPDQFEEPTFTTGHAKPDNVPPNVTYNSYTWTTYNPPLIDNSGIIEVIESEINVINYLMGWLKDNIHGEFTNLIDNIKNFINYIGATIQYYGGLILDAIINGINTFYNNMVSLIEPIFNSISYLTEPIDTAVIYDSYSSTSFNSDVTAVKTNFTSFVTQFNNIQEPTTYKIPIHFESITMFADVGTQYIQLDWLNSVKTLLRSFLWMVTTYGLLAAIFDAIPKYINGGGDEGD